jgi:ribose transport system permease protein
MGKSFSLKKIVRANSFALFLVTIVVILMFWFINKNYLSKNNILNIMYAMSFTGIIACGIGCLLISGAVDLSAGGTGCVAGVFAAVLMRAEIPWPAAIVIVLVFGFIAGAINAFFANVLNFMPFIATIGMASVWSGLAYVLGDGGAVAIGQQNLGFYKLSSATIFNFIPLPFLIMAALFLIYGFILTRTPFGREIYMCGGNRAAARLAGISPKKTTTVLFLNSGVVSALAGLLVAANNRMGSPMNVTGMEMSAIAAAILGGISFMGGAGGMSGAFIGLLLITCFNTGLISAGLPAYWQIGAQGVVLLVALLADYFSSKARLKNISGPDTAKMFAAR